MKKLRLEMSDGMKVYAVVKQPKAQAIGHIHFLHGMAEHSGRYVEVMDEFVRRGYIVTAHDHRGHGKTAEMNGKLGYFAEENGFHRVVRDAYEVIVHMKHAYPAKKFILFGHSMGSFIARRFIQMHGVMVDQVVLSGTGDDGGIGRLGGEGLSRMLGKQKGYKEPNPLLNSLVFGQFNQSVKEPSTPFDWLSTNSKIVASYLSDPYCGFVPTTQFFLDLFEGLKMIHQPKEIALIPKRMPILLFGGTEDPVGNYGKALWKVAEQYEKAFIENVTVLLFEGGRHELIGDFERPEVIELVEEWIVQDGN